MTDNTSICVHPTALGPCAQRATATVTMSPEEAETASLPNSAGEVRCCAAHAENIKRNIPRAIINYDD